MTDSTDYRLYLESKFKGLDKRFDDQDKILGEIKEQTIKTNGRVDILEGWKDKFEGAKSLGDDIQRKKLTTWQIVGIVGAVIIGLTTASMGVINTVNNKQRKEKVERIENWMDLWDFSPIVRGGQPILDTAKFDIKTIK